ncbi:TfuA-like protein [Parafrankia elaeagni]|uniref:TfuA-like protein n=1 Tax=Parafrankia elaeagni TaxID=222534 RepID=UPI000477AE2C|nr:TfuA-like protein [Parafrankia elaeagni]
MAEPRTIAYVGPSLTRAEVHRILPEARIEPPVRHGDLARLAAGPGDTVLLIDGLFLHSAAVRHKEILGLLADGVTVAGASSMGALRAAELWPYGMRGVGQVFDLYRDGVIDGDDEVAIVHADEENDSRAMSEPMVNIRLDLDRAAAAGVIDAGQREALVTAVGAQPFRGRSLPGLNRLARSLLPAATAEALAGWLREHHIDAKAADARALLALVANGSPWIRPPDGEDLAITGHDTMYAASWSQGFGGREVAGAWVTRDAVANTVALADPGFPRRYRLAVLTALVGGVSGVKGMSGVKGRVDVPGAPVPGAGAVERVERLGVDLARRRGLLDATGTLADACLGWLTPAERDGLPAAQAVLRVLARSHGTTPAARLAILPTVLPADITGWYERVAAVTTFADLALRRGAGRTGGHSAGEPNGSEPNGSGANGSGANGSGANGGGANGGGQRLRYELVDRYCAGLWGCAVDELEAGAWDRGFPDLHHLRRHAGDLAAHARWFPAAGTGSPSP